MTQIKLKPDGLWHRRMGAESTACGILIAGPFASRDYELDMSLCPVCFTFKERDTGRMEKEAREAAAFDEDADTDPDGAAQL